ncbi:hypothetical protein [Pedobacter sp. MC2016-24]|uniref:hypothetical protein n=1 Tax=Pedobacter sp. MC2016-24 TaxID=2780090 RepID=UPI001881252B|nr:hypothetical protein [Pedobacter sp. MC2016-24]MBE9599969.1 hypothetical protein [Pedobacter sp. MC2016-24]
MRFFKKRVRVAGNSDAVSARIAGLMLERQRQLADYLNERCAGLSMQWRIGLLIGFCTLIGAYLVYVLISAFTN